MHDRVETPLYFRLDDLPDRMLRVDFPPRSSSWWTDRRRRVLLGDRAVLGGRPGVLANKITWDDFSLTFRMRLNREPDIYHTVVQGFLRLEARGHELLLRAPARDRDQPGADRRRGRRDALRARPLLPAPGRRPEPRLGRGGALPHLPAPSVAIRPRERRRGERTTWAACTPSAWTRTDGRPKAISPAPQALRRPHWWSADTAPEAFAVHPQRLVGPGLPGPVRGLSARIVPFLDELQEAYVEPLALVPTRSPSSCSRRAARCRSGPLPGPAAAVECVRRGLVARPRRARAVRRGASTSSSILAVDATMCGSTTPGRHGRSHRSAASWPGSPGCW